MCFTIGIELSCFCDSRVIENITHNVLCSCRCQKLTDFQLGVCTLCLSKILILRKKVMSVLLAIKENDVSKLFYSNSVTIYVQKKIKI